LASEIKRQGTRRSQEVLQAKGEAVSPQSVQFLHDTLTIPDLAAVEASFGRSRLLSEHGPSLAAMALDAADSIQAGNSLEKMLAHQLAAAHRTAMEQMRLSSYDRDPAAQSKRLNAAAKCMTAYQNGLLTLRKLRQTGNQRITVQYVNVSEGGQAVIGNIEK
jgi:hypothetical protein